MFASFDWDGLIISYQSALEILAIAVGLVILLSSIDDAFIDAYYWIRRFYRRAIVRARHPEMAPEKLLAKPEVSLAIMVPAWQEADVIGAMLRTNIGLLRYANYHFFVGVYPNDPDTIREVDAVAAEYPNVHRVNVPHPGPTNKADCLNALIGGIWSYERAIGIRFLGIAMHDSEDVIHPLELKFFNFLIERKDLIQLPIYSLKCAPTAWVAGSYMDEFAEWHSKDLLVRESFTQTVPCAGVAACFSRRAMVSLWLSTGGEPFNTASLTEDYDIAFRLKKMGMKEVFVRFPVNFTIEAAATGHGLTLVTRRLPIATREYFPSEFRAAYRQRARWMLGIAFQGWQTIGWKGPLSSKYFFIRDRKALITVPASMLALFVIGNFLGIEAFYTWLAAGPRVPTVFEINALLGALLWVNIGFLATRLFHRIYFTSSLYGALHGVLSVPRLLVSQTLNFFAAMRATAVFIDSKITGRKIVWDKTAHTFPGGRPHVAAKTTPSVVPLRKAS